MRFYLSHPIRGFKGKSATKEDMKANNKAAIEVARHLRSSITPSSDIYVPAEMDNFLIPRGISPVYVIKELLALDCKIIESCDALLIFAPDEFMSKGCKVELARAIKHNIPVFIGKDAETLTNMIANFIMRI